MQMFTKALQVKDCSVFDLLHHTFYERDFVFFMRLTLHLGRMAGFSEKDAIVYGNLSELLYLSSLLHVSMTEQTETTAQLRAEKQMPVLLGDLLYGRFVSTLVENKKMAYLQNYLDYLRRFNANGVDSLEGRAVYTMEDAVQLLAEKTAEVMALSAGTEKTMLIAEAYAYFHAHWDALREKTVTTVEGLEALLQREFGQGAMVC